VDLIYHDLDPEQLRELAPTIPFELIEEFMFIGKASEIADRVSGHSAMAAPGPSPASTTSGSNPRCSKCAAAANPCGPAPITTTGDSVIDDSSYRQAMMHRWCSFAALVVDASA
jgi:hypothetical protein